MNKKGFIPLDKNKANKRNSYLTGFTLIEIIVATFLLALVTTGLAYVFLAGKRHILHTRSKIQAAELARLFLAPLQTDVRQDQWGSNCLSAGTGCPGAQTVDNITYTPTYENSALLVDAQNPLGRLRKVKVTINWTEPSS